MIDNDDDNHLIDAEDSSTDDDDQQEDEGEQTLSLPPVAGSGKCKIKKI